MRGALHELLSSRIELFLQAVRVFLLTTHQDLILRASMPAPASGKRTCVGLPGSICDN